MRRPVPAIVVALFVAAAGAVILGEQDLSGSLALVAGGLFGIAVAEVTATLSRARADPPLLGAVTLVTEGGLVWAIWISTGHRLDLAAVTAWLGVAAGMVAAPVWLRSAGRRAARTPDAASPSPDA